MVTYLGSPVQLSCGEGGTLQTSRGRAEGKVRLSHIFWKRSIPQAVLGVDMCLSKFWEMVKDREAWCAAVRAPSEQLERQAEIHSCTQDEA